MENPKKFMWKEFFEVFTWGSAPMIDQERRAPLLVSVPTLLSSCRAVDQGWPGGITGWK
jgi:hypothetical protein